MLPAHPVHREVQEGLVRVAEGAHDRPKFDQRIVSGTEKSAQQPKSAPEIWNIVPIRAWSSLFRAHIFFIALRPGAIPIIDILWNATPQTHTLQRVRPKLGVLDQARADVGKIRKADVDKGDTKSLLRGIALPTTE